jgi:hypothetical protein
MSVFPKLNSLIGMPNPTIPTPTMTAMAPTTNSTIDIPTFPRLARLPVLKYRITYSDNRNFGFFRLSQQLLPDAQEWR